MGPRIVNFIINTFLISIPEEAFIVAFVLIFTGLVERLSINKKNIVSFFIPVLLTASISGFLRKVLGMGFDYIPFLSLAIIFVSVMLIYKLKTLKKILNCAAASIVGMIIPGIIQLSYIPITMSILGLTQTDIRKVDLAVFCISLPERVIEILIISVLVYNKKNLIKINPLRIIARNRQISVIFFSCLVLDMVFVYIFTYAIYVKQILRSLSIIMQLLSVGAMIIVPVVNIASIIGIVYVLAYREKSKRMYMVEETKAVSALISILSKRGNFTQIQDELKEFNKQIKDIDLIK